MAQIGRHVLVDLSPVRRSRDLRCLVVGQLLSALGAQLTMVAVAVVTGGPRIGDAESGAVAAALSPVTSVISGGLACIGGALLLARVLPAFRRQEMAAVQDGAQPVQAAEAA
jgi:hypothetical protein